MDGLSWEEKLEEYYEFNCPNFDEQTAIAKILETADNEIKIIKTKHEALKEQKKGLMQVLLTGKVRIK